MKDKDQSSKAPLSPARQGWLMLVVIAPMAACYPAIKLGLGFAPPLQFAGARTLLGGLLLFEPHQTITWTGGFVGLLLFLALAGTALSTWLWFWLLQRAEAGRLSLYLFLVPVSGLLIAISGFGERLNLLQAGGVGMILTAVALSVFGGWFGAAKRTDPPHAKA